MEMVPEEIQTENLLGKIFKFCSKIKKKPNNGRGTKEKARAR